MNITNKFGNLSGWNNVTLNLLGRDIEGITELEYDDEQEIEVVYGAGNMPIGHSAAGNYAAKASITILQEERQALMAALPLGKRLQDIAAFDVIASFEVSGKVYTDVIRSCRIKNNGVAVKQNDKSIAFKLELVPIKIDFNQ